MPKLSKEMKDQVLREIQHYFHEERGEEIGDLAAENFLVFIKDKIGPVFYNQAIHDAKKIVEQRMLTLEEDLFSLEKDMR